MNDPSPVFLSRAGGDHNGRCVAILVGEAESELLQILVGGRARRRTQ
jgi:hypothetical protein